LFDGAEPSGMNNGNLRRMSHAQKCQFLAELLSVCDHIARKVVASTSKDGLNDDSKISVRSLYSKTYSDECYMEPYRTLVAIQSEYLAALEYQLMHPDASLYYRQIEGMIELSLPLATQFARCNLNLIHSHNPP